MSVDLSGEITAIATAVLATFAIITAIVAYMAFRRQTQAREARERHRAQASRVFIALAIPQQGPARFNVVNTSEQPVYDVEIEWRDNDAIAANTHRRQLAILGR